MSDFKTGLLLDSVQDNAWWGLYDRLESLQTPLIENLKKTQRKILANQEVALDKKCKDINLFLNQIKNYNIDGLEEDTERVVDDAIGQRLMKLINAALSHERNSEDSILKEGEKNIEQTKQAVKNLKEMVTLLKKLTSSSTINGSQLDKFLILIKKAYANALISNSTSYKYVQGKANAAEYAVATVIEQHHNWKAVVTGNWVDEKGQQLIEDVFVFDKETLKSYGNKTITIKITTKKGKTKKIEKKLKDVLEIKGTVKLGSDESYNLIRQLKLFSVQAKSGIGQRIFTNAKRNAISLDEIGRFGEANAVYDLYVEDIGRSDARWFKPTEEQNSKSLNVFANMQLSQNILSTVLSKNEVYFTVDGFVTAREWLIKRNSYVTFKDRITQLSIDMMTTPRAITIAS